MQRILDGALDRLVVFRERPISNGADRDKQTSHTFRIHDKRAHVVFRLRVSLEVRHIVASPLLRRFVPPHLLA